MREDNVLSIWTRGTVSQLLVSATDTDDRATPLSAWEKEWPHWDFSPYANLLRTCRQLHAEARSLFESEYLPHLVFPFSDVHRLYTFDQLRRNSHLKTLPLKFRLRRWNEHFAGGATQLLLATSKFMHAQQVVRAAEELRCEPEFRDWMRDAWVQSRSEKNYRAVWKGQFEFSWQRERGVARYCLLFDGKELPGQQGLCLRMESRELENLLDKVWSIEGRFEELDWSGWKEEDMRGAEKGYEVWEGTMLKRAIRLSPIEAVLAKRKRSSSSTGW